MTKTNSVQRLIKPGKRKVKKSGARRSLESKKEKGLVKLQRILLEIINLKGMSLSKLCKLLNIPIKREHIGTKEVSGYTSRAHQLLEELKKNG